MKKQKLWVASTAMTLAVLAITLVALIWHMTPTVSAGQYMYDGVGGTFTGSGPSQTAAFNTPENALNGWGLISGTLNEEAAGQDGLEVMPFKIQVKEIIVGASAYSAARDKQGPISAPSAGEHGVFMKVALTNPGSKPISVNWLDLNIGAVYSQYWVILTDNNPHAYTMPGKSRTYYVYANVPDTREMVPYLRIMCNDGKSVDNNNYVYMSFPVSEPEPSTTETPKAPTIVTQPKSKGVAVGTVAEYYVDAYGMGTLSYQWQYRKNSSSEWANSGMKGAKTDTLKVTATEGLDGYQFRCIITDPSNGMQSITNAASLSVNLRILAQPADRNAAQGSTAKIQIVASGVGTLTYRWQQRSSASGTWTDSNFSGANTDTLSVAATSAHNGWQFRCQVSDSRGEGAESTTATLHVVPITISSQPTDQTAQATTVAKFTVEASGTGNLTYQWQARKDATSSWTNSGASGAKSKTVSITASGGLDGWQYRCLVTDGNGRTAETEEATLSVRIKVTSQPANVTAVPGMTAKFTVAAAGKAPLSYQWQARKNADAAWANSGQPGAKTTTLSVNASAGLNGWQYRCVVTDGNGLRWGSNAATLTVGSIAVTTQPSDQRATAGSTAKFSVSAVGSGTLTYQWQARKNADAAWAKSGQPGAQTATLSVSATAGLNGWQFRCVVRDSANHQIISKVATLAIVPKITAQPTSVSVKVGVKANFTIRATGTGTLKYQWQARKNSSSEWANSGQSGAKTATVSVNAIAGLNGWQFRCVVTDANGQQSYSDPAVLTVK